MRMNLFKAIALSSALALLAASAAQAQPTTTYTYSGQNRTYSAAVTALAPASSATDLITLSGVAGKSIQLRKVTCSGISTAAAAAVLKVVKRSTLDTAGTSTSPTAVPLNSAQPAAQAVIKQYTANPTVGTAVGDVASGELVTGPAASATGNPPLVFDFTNQQVFLNSATELVAVNGNGASLSAGAALNCTVEWQE